MDYKKLSRITDSVNSTTLVEEVLDADFQVIKREIDEKGSCFKTAEKIASLIGSTKGGVEKFAEELKNSDIKGISYKKGEKDDYMGIRGTVVYGAEDSVKLQDSEESPQLKEFKDRFEEFFAGDDASTTITIQEPLTENELTEVWNWANELVEDDDLKVRIVPQDPSEIQIGAEYFVELI